MLLCLSYLVDAISSFPSEKFLQEKVHEPQFMVGTKSSVLNDKVEPSLPHK